MLTTFATPGTTSSHRNRGDSTMYPLHTGSVLLDVATAQRNELIAASGARRRARLARHPSTTTRPDFTPKRHWWWGLARHHRAA